MRWPPPYTARSTPTAAASSSFILPARSHRVVRHHRVVVVVPVVPNTGQLQSLVRSRQLESFAVSAAAAAAVGKVYPRSDLTTVVTTRVHSTPHTHVQQANTTCRPFTIVSNVRRLSSSNVVVVVHGGRPPIAAATALDVQENDEIHAPAVQLITRWTRRFI